MKLNRTFYTKVIIVFFALANTLGCIERFSLPDIEGESLLVVDGFVDINSLSATVKLSHSRDLTSKEPIEPVSGAIVSVKSNNGEVMQLEELESGHYYANKLSLSFDHSYQLLLNIDGKSYVSDYVKGKHTPKIDSVYWKPKNDGIGIYLDTHDSENNTTFYKWKYEETWHFRAALYSQLEYNYETQTVSFRNEDIYNCWRGISQKNISVASTENISQDVVKERLIRYIPYYSDKINIKYSILVKQQAIDRQAFKYWGNIKANTESLGTLFDPIPYGFRGNIHSQSDPDEFILGYFSVGTMTEQRIFIEHKEVRDILEFSRSFCLPDTLLPEELNTLNTADNLISAIYSGSWLRGYTIAPKSCSDCTLIGTNIKPDFWE